MTPERLDAIYPPGGLNRAAYDFATARGCPGWRAHYGAGRALVTLRELVPDADYPGGVRLVDGDTFDLGAYSVGIGSPRFSPEEPTPAPVHLRPFYDRPSGWAKHSAADGRYAGPGARRQALERSTGW